jgi:hypothetical protein
VSRLSPRFAPWIAGVFLLVAVPVAHDATARGDTGCVGGLATQTPIEKTGPDGGVLRYELTATQEPWRLYGWPPSALAGGPFPPDTLQRDLEVGDTVLPVQWDADTSRGYSRVRGYFLLLDGEPVESLFRSGAARAFGQVLGDRLPAARVMVYGTGALHRHPQNNVAVEERLIEAWHEIQRSCRT